MTRWILGLLVWSGFVYWLYEPTTESAYQEYVASFEGNEQLTAKKGEAVDIGMPGITVTFNGTHRFDRVLLQLGKHKVQMRTGNVKRVPLTCVPHAHCFGDIDLGKLDGLDRTLHVLWANDDELHYAVSVAD